MKGIIFYYSGTGNTKLACEYLVKKMPAVEWALHNMAKSGLPDLPAYDVAGFATFTDFWSVPQKFITFMKSLPERPGTLAFGFNTYGMVSLFTLRDMGRLLRQKKFLVVDGFSLHMPENYPPMIMGGMANENAPNPKELEAFDKFIQNVNQKLEVFQAGKTLKKHSLGGNPWLGLIPAPGRLTARKSMGEKYVDTALCTQCRTCEKNCPYTAIALDPYPKFDMSKCYGCWACFNRCPKKAIYTKKFRGQGHYPRPLPQVLKKFGE